MALMALLSIAVVLAPSELLRRSLELHATHYPAHLVDDAPTGGNSRVAWVDKDSQRWQCELNPSHPTPYCNIHLDVTGADGKGLDLSGYDRMTVWADYRGSGSRVRIYLRNRHPNYYVPEFDMSTKYNMVEVPVEALATGLELSMTDFTVAGWWLIAGNVPLAYSHPEFNDVSSIELQTGSMERSGIHELQLQKIVWSGQLISQAQLYQAVIVTWILFIFGMLLYRLAQLNREMKQQRKYQQELLTINAALNVESRRYEDLAKTDALTGLRNRVGIRDILHQGLTDWRRYQTPFSFVIIDLDRFKRINDTHGHDVGDQILKEAAELMFNCVRRSDALARWGGEEFVLVCPDTTLDQARQAAENLRVLLEKHLRYGGEVVTASFGVASMSEPNLDHLFKKADTALYNAKKLGRNRVCTETSAQQRIA